MYRKNKTEILADIFKNLKSSKCSLKGIIAPPFSGKSSFLNDITKSLSEEHEFIVFRRNAEDYKNPHILIEELQLCIAEHSGDLNDETFRHLSIGDAIYDLVNHCYSDIFKSIIFLIDDVDKLTHDEIFNLLSQFRNVRENVNANNDHKRIFFICIGSWIPSLLRKKFSDNQGSYPFEEVYMNDLSYEEIELLSEHIFYDKSKPSVLFLEYLSEISGGCFGIVDYMLKQSVEKNTQSCAFIRNCINTLVKEEFFEKSILKALSSLEPSALDKIRLLMKNKYLKYENNFLSEELILSGLVRKIDFYGVEAIALRSWVHEIFLRTNNESSCLMGLDNEKFDIKEIIAPTPCINKHAYKTVLEIENLLRNILYIGLSEDKSFSLSPYEHASSLGKMNDKWNTEILYDELILRRNISENDASVRSEKDSPLSSFLQPSELKKLIVDNRGLNTIFESYFLPNDKNKKLLRKWTDIRNLVAHNHVITEETVDKLSEIAKSIYIQIVI